MLESMRCPCVRVKGRQTAPHPRCWLLWFYTCLALRENVLRVNGSNIRNWWINHHYYSVGLALTVLTMPFDSPACQAFIVRFLVCAVIQARPEKSSSGFTSASGWKQCVRFLSGCFFSPMAIFRAASCMFRTRTSADGRTPALRWVRISIRNPQPLKCETAEVCISPYRRWTDKVPCGSQGEHRRWRWCRVGRGRRAS